MSYNVAYPCFALTVNGHTKWSKVWDIDKTSSWSVSESIAQSRHVPTHSQSMHVVYIISKFIYTCVLNQYIWSKDWLGVKQESIFPYRSWRSLDGLLWDIVITQPSEYSLLFLRVEFQFWVCTNHWTPQIPFR